MSKQAPLQARITRRLALRTAILGFALAAGIWAFQWYQGVRGNIDEIRPANTVDMIGAVKFEDEGQKVVVFNPDGSMIENQGYTAGTIDRDLEWNPSGQRLFFVSNRKEGTFNIFRWNPDGNDEPAQRTIGNRGRSNPSFPRQALPNGDESALITSGGYVLSFDPREVATIQILPPISREITSSSEEEGGAVGQFDGVYKQFGESFKEAKWMKGRKFVAAVMRRDEGEVLILQNMEPKDDQEMMPVPIAAGDLIEMDVNPNNGDLVYIITNFQWPSLASIPPEFRKNNRITTPFKNMIAILNPETPAEGGPIIVTQDVKTGFRSPSISPDGATLIFVAGEYDQASGNFAPNGIISVPAKSGSGSSGSGLVRGEVYEPSWSPDGTKIAYVKLDGKQRSIFTMAKDGSGERNISGDKGDFSSPKFSPQRTR